MAMTRRLGKALASGSAQRGPLIGFNLKCGLVLLGQFGCLLFLIGDPFCLFNAKAAPKSWERMFEPQTGADYSNERCASDNAGKL